jgi:hypothetical protein
MNRWMTTLMVFALCSAVVRADVTVVQTTTIEGGMAAMGGGAAPSPTTTTRIKGQKRRDDVEVPSMMQLATITDLAAKQIMVLRPDQKTATVVTPTTPAAGTGAPAGTVPPKVTAPDVDASIKPTGKTQVIDGITCDEYAFTSSVNMSEMGGAQVPPEVSAMMKDMKMNMVGSMWVAKDVPGAAEYIAFQKAAAASNLGSAMATAAGMKMPGMEKMTQAMASMNGMTYLTEMSMTVEGTGQMADMMRQMGAMKITTKVTSVKTDAIADDQFTVPADYKVIKQ